MLRGKMSGHPFLFCCFSWVKSLSLMCSHGTVCSEQPRESWEERRLDFPQQSINRNPLTINTCPMPGEKERAESGTSRHTRYPQVFQSLDRHRLWFGQECGLHLKTRSDYWARSPEPHSPARVFLLKSQPQNEEIWHCCSISVNSQMKVFPGGRLKKNLSLTELECLDISLAL